VYTTEEIAPDTEVTTQGVPVDRPRETRSAPAASLDAAAEALEIAAGSSPAAGGGDTSPAAPGGGASPAPPGGGLAPPPEVPPVAVDSAKTAPGGPRQEPGALEGDAPAPARKRGRPSKREVLLRGFFAWCDEKGWDKDGVRELVHRKHEKLGVPASLSEFEETHWGPIKNFLATWQKEDAMSIKAELAQLGEAFRVAQPK
ncbi:MAG: hypothetical protein AAB368_01115, partial [bacterium]